MIPVRINFPGQLNNAIAATQSITATAGGGVVLNGSSALISNQTPSATTATTSNGYSNQPVVLAGVARPIVIFATSSATNCIFTVVGKDLLGNIITATIVGASGGGATVTTPGNLATTNGVDFHIISGVVSSASVGNFTVGFGATGETNWIVASLYKTPFSMTVGASVLTATTTTYTIQDTPDNVQTATAPNVFANATISAIATTALESNYAFPVSAVRGIVTTNSATGGVQFFFNQAGP